MKKLTLILILGIATFSARSQEIQKNLKPFSRIVASPRINVILTKGDQESIRLVYHDIAEDRINIKVTGTTLRIYLDNARKVERKDPTADKYGNRERMYSGASITAYVTYDALEMLEIRGEQELTSDDPLTAEKFILRAYGENEINLASLRTGFFKAKLYGENRLRIRKGIATEQKFALYGENTIDTRPLQGDYIYTRIFGEGTLKVNSTEEVHINAFGEPEILVDGGARIWRGLVIGKAHIRHN